MLRCVVLRVAERISRRAAGRSLSHLAEINQTRIQRRSARALLREAPRRRTELPPHTVSAGLFGFF